MDILNFYNDISEAAERAFQKTSALIKQNQVLSNIKPVAGTLFHGALGPGLMVYDPMSQFVKGEATFAKAAKDFVVDAKQFEMGGKIAARGIQAAGESAFQSSSKMSRGVQTVTKTIREWTSTSKMMEDTLKTLAGRTGVMATSFKGLASVIKVATGPIGTALMVTTVAYDQFVKRWMDNSARLEKSIKSVSNIFKEGDTWDVRAGMNQWTAQGGSRREFLTLMGRGGSYLQGATTGQAAMAAEVARAVSRQTGRPLTAQFEGLAEHLYARRLQGATKEEIDRDLLERRVMAGGPGATTMFKGPLERYREWGEDTGAKFNRAFQGWSPGDIVRSMTFMRRGGGLERARQGVVGALNYAMENRLPGVPGFFPAIRNLGEGVSGLAGLAERGSASWDMGMGGMRLMAGKYLAQAGPQSMLNYIPGLRMLLGNDLNKAGEALQLQGGVGALSGISKKTGIALSAEQEKLTKEESGLRGLKEAQVAYEKYQEMKTKHPEVINNLLKIASEQSSALEKGDTESFEKAQKSIEDLARKTGKDVKDLVELKDVTDNYKKEIEEIAKNPEKFKQRIKEGEKRVEDSGKRVTALGKAIKSFTGIDVLPEGKPKGKEDITDLSYTALEDEIRRFEEDETKKLKEIRRIRLRGTPQEKTQLSKLEEQYARMQFEKEGFTKEQIGELQKARTAGDTAKEMEILSQREETRIRNLSKRLHEEGRSEAVVATGKTLKAIANVEIPAAIQMYLARGIITSEQKEEIEGIKGEDKEYGIHTADMTRMEMQKYTAQHAAKMQEVKSRYIPKQRQMQSAGIAMAASELAARGLIGKEEVDKINELAKEGKEHSIAEAHEVLQLAQQRVQLRRAAVDVQYLPRERQLHGAGLSATAGGMAAQGLINEKDVERINTLVKKGDEISLHHAEKILQITQQRAQVEETILQTKIQVIHREGAVTGIGLQIGSQARRGIAPLLTSAADRREVALRIRDLQRLKNPTEEDQKQLTVLQGQSLMQGIIESKNPRLISRSQETMKNILSIREQMFRAEIDFTLRYAQARMHIIQVHYDNMNQLETTRLTQLDRKFSAYIQYGQAVFGLQGTMVQAQMGRYAGGDYWRQQYRGARGLAEQRRDIIMGAAGYQMPRELQIARALRENREARGDYRRQQARQREEDQANIQAAMNTQEAIRKQLGIPVDIGRRGTETGGDLGESWLGRIAVAPGRGGAQSTEGALGQYGGKGKWPSLFGKEIDSEVVYREKLRNRRALIKEMSGIGEVESIVNPPSEEFADRPQKQIRTQAQYAAWLRLNYAGQRQPKKTYGSDVETMSKLGGYMGYGTQFGHYSPTGTWIGGRQEGEGQEPGRKPYELTMEKFYQSEGGRQLLMGMLQRNQASYSRMGIDVSGRIKQLAQEQQEFEAKKLATTMRVRGRETASMEDQTKVMEEEVGKLPEGSRKQQEVKLALAEQYKRMAGQYMATGDLEKAEEASKKQEELLKDIPEEMKKDFGDTAKQQLNELKTQTNILNSINEVLGGKTPVEEGKEIPEEKEGKTEKLDEKGKPEDKMQSAADTMLKAADKLANVKVDVNVNGGTATTSQSGAGSYGNQY